MRALLLLCITIAAMAGEARRDDDPAAWRERVLAALADLPAATAPATRRLLVFGRTNGFRHACIPVAAMAFTELGARSGAWTATVSEDPAALAPAQLAGYDGLLLNNTTRLRLDDATRQGLLDFVAAGKGLVGIHAATDNFYDFRPGAELLCGQFDGHPWGAGGTWRFRVEDPGHPVVAAFPAEGFAFRDEIYQFNDIYRREAVRVLLGLDLRDAATAKAKGQKRADRDYPVAWVRRAGAGRVFYSCLGHNTATYADARVLRHYLAGIRFALGDLDVPVESLPFHPHTP